MLFLFYIIFIILSIEKELFIKNFDITDENKLVRDFERENRTLFDAEKQVKIEDKEKEIGLER